MAEETIDWEHTMKDTQIAARAASRGGERMIKAMAEIKDEQTTLIKICREHRKETAAIAETAKSLETAQMEQYEKNQHLFNRRFSPPSQSEKRWQKSRGLALFVGLVCGVFIGNLL